MEEGPLAKSVGLIIFRGKCQGRLAGGGDSAEETRKMTGGDLSKGSSASGTTIPLENLMKTVSL